MHENRHRNLSAAFGSVVFLIIAAYAFWLSVEARAPWLGEAPMNIAGWMTGGSTQMARNWYREGAWPLRFAMYWEPASAEQQYAGARTPYVSYPPGAILPLHLLALRQGKEPVPGLAMSLNLALQGITAILLSATGTLLLRRAVFSRWTAFVLAPVPFLLYVYLPISYHEHAMSYFADAAVLPLYALFILLEVCRERARSPRVRRWLALSQALAGFCGILTDWLFVFLACCVWLARVFRGTLGDRLPVKVRNTLLLGLPFAAGVALFLGQVILLDGMDQLLERFLMRSGVTPGQGFGVGRNPLEFASANTFFTFSLDTRFWKEHIPASFGRYGAEIIAGCLAAWLVATVLAMCAALRRRWLARGADGERGASPHGSVGALLAACFLYLAPCLLYYHVFKQHNNLLFHRYSALKFAVPLAAMPLVLLPAAYWRFWFPARVFQTWPVRCASRMAPLLLLAGAALLLISLTPERRALFASDDDLRHVPSGKFIGQNTTPEDILFAPAPPPWADMPQFQAYAMKRLHPAKSLWELYAFLRGIDGPWQAAVFLDRADRLDRLPELQVLAHSARVAVSEGAMTLLFIDKARFVSLCDGLGVSARHPNDQNVDHKLAIPELTPLMLAYEHQIEIPDWKRELGGIPHPADYAPETPDGRISLSELLRQFQLCNSGGYHLDAGAEGHFAPGLE